MIAGLDNASGGGSMFSRLTLGMEPDAEEMERAAAKVLYQKYVKLDTVHVETFDLGDKVEAKKYAKILQELYVGMQKKTHMILFNDRQFVTENGNPRWIAHLEWAVFEMTVKHNTPVRSAQEEQGNAEESTDKE